MQFPEIPPPSKKIQFMSFWDHSISDHENRSWLESFVPRWNVVPHNYNQITYLKREFFTCTGTWTWISFFLCKHANPYTIHTDLVSEQSKISLLFCLEHYYSLLIISTRFMSIFSSFHFTVKYLIWSSPNMQIPVWISVLDLG